MMNSVLQRSYLGGLGLVLGTLGVGQAQQANSKPLAKNILGSWRYVQIPPITTSGFGFVSHTYTFRADSTALETYQWRFDADTFSCTNKLSYDLREGSLWYWYWWQRDVPDSVKITWTRSPRVFTAGDTVDWGDNFPHPVLQAKQFAISGRQRAIYTQVASADVFSPDYFTLRSTSAATGKAATLVGSWEELPGRGVKDEQDVGLVRRTLSIRPDLSAVQTETWEDGPDTFTCTREWEWKEGDSMAGDTVLLGRGRADSFDGKFLVQGQELSIYLEAKDNPSKLFRVYKRVDRVPKP